MTVSERTKRMLDLEAETERRVEIHNHSDDIQVRYDCERWILEDAPRQLGEILHLTPEQVLILADIVLNAYLVG